MATGPEFFRKAVESLPLIHQETDGAWAVARAVESLTLATLSLAAATAMGTAPGGMNPVDLEEWDRLCGAQEPDDEEPCARCCEYGHEAGDCEAILNDEDAIDPTAPFAEQRARLADANPLRHTPLARAFGAIPDVLDDQTDLGPEFSDGYQLPGEKEA